MDFFSERQFQANKNFQNEELLAVAKSWHDMSRRHNYQYMFEVLGLPIIQDPQDIVMLQELIWRHKPDVVIETGIARGGSLVLSASLLALFGYIDMLKSDTVKIRKVIGIDIEIRKENLDAISNHPLSQLITLVEGSSTDSSTLGRVKELIPPGSSVMVILDSNHTHEHVAAELLTYCDLVTTYMPLVVMDTGIDFADSSTLNPNRNWGKGNSPYSAIKEFLEKPIGRQFETSREIETRHLITCAPEGVLIRTAL